MSCNCGNCLPYCWSSNFLEPADPCPVGPECVDKISTDCVIYKGPNLPCLGVTTDMTLTEILHILFEGIYPECFASTTTTSTSTTTTSSTTTTTTAEPIECFCYTINNPTEGSIFMTWTRCSDGVVLSQSVAPGGTFYRCSRTPVTGNDLVITGGIDSCATDFDCVPE